MAPSQNTSYVATLVKEPPLEQPPEQLSTSYSLSTRYVTPASKPQISRMGPEDPFGAAPKPVPVTPDVTTMAEAVQGQVQGLRSGEPFASFQVKEAMLQHVLGGDIYLLVVQVGATEPVECVMLRVLKRVHEAFCHTPRSNARNGSVYELQGMITGPGACKARLIANGEYISSS